MKNTIKKFFENNKHIIIPVFFLILLVNFVYKAYGYHLEQLAKKDIEIQNQIKATEEAKGEAYAAKRTKIQIIKNQIEFEKENEKYYKDELDLAQKKYESTIWYRRCLEVEGELELKGNEYNLECNPFIIDEMLGEFSNENYEQLKKFATYNLQKTKENLGL